MRNPLDVAGNRDGENRSSGFGAMHCQMALMFFDNDIIADTQAQSCSSARWFG